MSNGATNPGPGTTPQAGAGGNPAPTQTPPPITPYVNPHAGLVRRFLNLPPLILGGIAYVIMFAIAIVLKFTIAQNPAFIVAAAFTIITSIAVAVVLFVVFDEEKFSKQQKAGWMWLHLILWTAITFLPFGDFPKLSLAAVLLMAISETGYMAALSKDENENRDKDGKLLVSAFARPSAGILVCVMISFWLWSLPAVGGNITRLWGGMSKSFASINLSKEADDKQRRAEWEQTANKPLDLVPDAFKGSKEAPSGTPGTMTVMNPNGTTTVMRAADAPEPAPAGRQVATLSGWRSPLQFNASSTITTDVTGEVDFNRPLCIIRGGNAGGDIIIDSCTMSANNSYEGEWHQERSGARGVYAMTASGNNASISLRVQVTSGLISVGEISLTTGR